jgi:hypothetical protein
MASSRASRGADAAEAGNALTVVPPTQPSPEPGIEIETVPRDYFRATVSLPKGYPTPDDEARTVTCAHPFAHENPKAAMACGRKIARLGHFEK